jgi:TP53 regulating kinase-like protein
MKELLEQQLREITGPIAIHSLSQGAEAIVYTTDTHPYVNNAAASYIIKYRPPKPYRHPTLDAQLTKHRTLTEARILHKVLSLGVSAPKLVFVDPRKGIIWMEFVEGISLKQWIWDQEDGANDLKEILLDVGREIGKLHVADIVHGDLTTSNIMLNAELKPVIIDFGLASHSSLAEDKAVDLYVMERAVESTHPVHSSDYNQWLLEGYLHQHDKSGKTGSIKGKEVIRKLQQVRLRGRKRSMVG